MSRFNVDTDSLRSAAGRCDDISWSITTLRYQIRDIKGSLNNEMGRYNSVMNALDICAANARMCSARVSNLGNTGVRIANEYNNTENNISGNIQLDKFGNVQASSSAGMHASEFLSLFNRYLDWFRKPIITFGIPISVLLRYINLFYGHPGTHAEAQTDSWLKVDSHFKKKLWENDSDEYNWDSEKKKWVKKEDKDGKEKKNLRKEAKIEREYDPKQKKWVEASEKEKKKGWASIEKEVKLHEWSPDMPHAEVINKGGVIGGAEGDIGKLEGNVKVLAAETHANSYVGLLTAGGAIGASATAFTADGLAELGNDNLGVYAGGSVTVGRAGAEAEGSIGLFDKYGNFNPNAKVEASAEIIAGEITGKAGAKVLGTDVGVQGSLNVGVGAHANVGYSDGKLSLDIGASLGVGASVKLDIDVSGTVNAVCDGAKAVWNGFKGLFGK